MTVPRIVVTGGNPTDEELAALTAALAHHRSTAATPDESEPSMSPWTRAARLEGCGHPPIDSPTRLVTHR